MADPKKQGNRAERINPNGYLQNIGSYVTGFTSYFGKSFQGQPTGGQVADEREKITWVGFDTLELPNRERKQVLVLAYNNGFQVWDIQNLDDIREIVSRRDLVSVKFAKFFPNSEETETQGMPFFQKRPILAVCSRSEGESNETPLNNCVQLVSLVTNETVSKMRFKSEVYSVLATSRYVVVALHDYLYVLNAHKMEKIQNIKTSPQTIENLPGVVALGMRWLAFPCVDQPPTMTNLFPPQKATSNFTEVAKDIATGLFQYGRDTITDYMQKNDQKGQPIKQEEPNMETNSNGATHLGIVKILDLERNRDVAHFRAHKRPLSLLAFDPSGLLLVTSSVGGRSLNIFRITPNTSNFTHINYLPLYKLQRGITHASITNVSFTADSRWLAVTTSHATTHIFAIHPSGEPITLHSHTQTHSDPTPPSDLIGDFMSLTAMTRVKYSTTATTVVEEYLRGGASSVLPSSASFLTISRKKESGKGSIAETAKELGGVNMFVCFPNGTLGLYNLKCQKALSTETTSPHGFNVSNNAIIEWETCRRSKWTALLYAPPVPTKSDNINVSVMPGLSNWHSQMETVSHAPVNKTLYTDGQFVFRKMGQNVSKLIVPNVGKQEVPSKPASNPPGQGGKSLIVEEDEEEALITKVKKIPGNLQENKQNGHVSMMSQAQSQPEEKDPSLFASTIEEHDSKFASSMIRANLLLEAMNTSLAPNPNSNPNPGSLPKAQAPQPSNPRLYGSSPVNNVPPILSNEKVFHSNPVLPPVSLENSIYVPKNNVKLEKPLENFIIDGEDDGRSIIMPPSALAQMNGNGYSQQKEEDLLWMEDEGGQSTLVVPNFANSGLGV